MLVYPAAILIGAATGARSMIGLAFVSWAAYFGLLNLDGTWFAFLGYRFVPFLLTAFAVGELVFDKLPGTPSRKSLLPFAGRIISGAVASWALGSSGQNALGGAAAGVAGAVLGTLAGYRFRMQLAASVGDLPAALIEDGLVIAAAVFAIVLIST